ncbi:multivesicular body subunit 12Bb [Lampris incognitus]|uniref:multivesicular body subunit 12Bb n=1 Tax=Lampris incognitus TaxID=2546036 RepID=UPI0024B5143A|nr:multivesicular body subunit 12Bb [Lampris incognitus]
MSTAQDQSKNLEQLSEDPITAVGVVASHCKAPDGYHVVAQTTDGSDADLWKDGLFKSKVTRYLCFTRKNDQHGSVVVDMRLIDIKDTLPEGFTAVQETVDTREPAMRKRRLCVKLCPGAAAKTAVVDIQITGKSKHHLVNYTCIGELNSLEIWYRMGDALQIQQSLQRLSITAVIETPPNTASPNIRTTSRPDYENQNSGVYTMSAMDDVPFLLSEKFYDTEEKMQRVNLMGITIKSLAEIEEEFHYNFSMEQSVAPHRPSPSLRRGSHEGPDVC